MSLEAEEKLNSFIDAFSSHMGGCRRDCVCGKTFYNPNGGWDWNEGEVEKLFEEKATPLDWSVGTIIFENKEYVIDCQCWRDRAKKFMAMVDHYAAQIVEYLTREKTRKYRIAEESPVVGKGDEPKCDVAT